jgi:hypothetical protein
MDAAVLYRPGRHPQDTEDLAYEFMEQEVGRFDWKNNWPRFKANHEGILTQRVQAWLDYIGIDYDANEIIRFLDKMVETTDGKWK